MPELMINSTTEIDDLSNDELFAGYSNVKNAHQKGGKLTGGSLTREALDSSRSVLAANRAGNTVGLQQYYTPTDVAGFIRSVVNPFSTVAVFDPTAGDGSLLSAFVKHKRYGVEIDPDQIENSLGDPFSEGFDPGRTNEYTALQGDLQRLFPLLHLSDARFTAIVANPPFGLTWNEAGKNPSRIINGGKPCSSTRWTWEAIQKLLKQHGQGAFICGTNRLENEILSDPNEARRVYAIVDIPDLFPGVALECSVTFFADPDALRTPAQAPRIMRLSAHREAFTPELWRVLAKDIERHRAQFYTYITGYDTLTEQGFKQIFADIQTEHKRRRRQDEGHKNAVYDVEIRHSKLHVTLSPLATVGLRREHGSDALQSVRSLHGQRINYFALNMKDWNRLKSLESKAVLTIDPKASGQIQSVIDKANADLCPMYQIKPQQRLGYLADSENITCTVTDEAKGFFEGQTYPITTESEISTSTRTEVKIDKDGRANELLFQTDRKVLKITIDARTEEDKKGYAPNRLHIFRETKEDIDFLLEHFDIPDPGDLATRFPAEMEDRRKTLREIEAQVFGKNEWGRARWPEGVTLKDYQREDLCRLLLKGGGVAALEQGLGKSVISLMFAEASYRRREIDGNCLFVIPQDLVNQWKDEARTFFGRELTHITTKAQAREIAQSIKRDHAEVAAHNREEHRRRRVDKNYPMNLRRVEGNWYCTHYECLAITGLQVKNFQQLDRVSGGNFLTTEPYVESRYKSPEGEYQADRVPLTLKGEQGVYPMPIQKARYKMVETLKQGHYDYEERRWTPDEIVKARRTITTEEICPMCGADTGAGWDGLQCKQKEHATGKPLAGCGYQHKRLHVKSMAHELTTAFKNGLITIDEGTKIQGDTSLTSLAVRGMRARRKLLCSGTPQKSYVQQMFWLLGWSLGFASPRFPFSYYGGKYKFEQDFCVTERLIGTNRRKILPEVTNLSVLWRLLSGGMVRRRKEDTGERIVERTFVPVTVPMGITQYKHLSYWVDKDNFVDFFCHYHPEANPQTVAMNSAIYGQFEKMDSATTMPTADKHSNWAKVIPDDFTPKAIEVLRIAAMHAAKGEKVLIGSNRLQMGKLLSDQLNAKGIKSDHILEGDAERGNLKTKSPMKRAAAVKAFQKGDTRVLCAGVQSINLGHNMDCASVVILNGLPWDSATLEQFLARVHRLTSKHPVTVYVVMTAGSMDERKWDLLQRKVASSELSLDGELQHKKQEAVSQQQVINEMARRGIPLAATKNEEGQVASEDACRAAWEAMTFDVMPIMGATPEKPVALESPKPLEKINPAIAQPVVKIANENGTIKQEPVADTLSVTQDGNRYTLECMTMAGEKLVFESRKVKPSMMKIQQEAITENLFAFAG